MTMTLTSKRQTVFPLEWCEREGLARGGPLNVFDLGKDGLLIRPIKAPGQEAVRKLLRKPPSANIRRVRRQPLSIRRCAKCVMNLAVIDTGVFVAGVFWRHEPHLCLKAWLHAGYDAGDDRGNSWPNTRRCLERVKQEQHFTTDTAPMVEYPANVSLVGYADSVSRKGVPRPQGQ